MNYLIVSVINGQEQLGSDSNTIVRDAKNMVKVNNAIKSFNPMRKPDNIRVYSWTNFYDPKTFKLIKTI
jgi:hypothetical protein